MYKISITKPGARWQNEKYKKHGKRLVRNNCVGNVKHLLNNINSEGCIQFEEKLNATMFLQTDPKCWLVWSNYTVTQLRVVVKQCFHGENISLLPATRGLTLSNLKVQSRVESPTHYLAKYKAGVVVYSTPKTQSIKIQSETGNGTTACTTVKDKCRNTENHRSNKITDTADDELVCTVVSCDEIRCQNLCF